MMFRRAAASWAGRDKSFSRFRPISTRLSPATTPGVPTFLLQFRRQLLPLLHEPAAERYRHHRQPSATTQRPRLGWSNWRGLRVQPLWDLNHHVAAHRLRHTSGASPLDPIYLNGLIRRLEPSVGRNCRKRKDCEAVSTAYFRWPVGTYQQRASRPSGSPTGSQAAGRVMGSNLDDQI